MTPPPLKTRLLGHPLVALTVTLMGMFLLYGCWQAGASGLLPGIAVLAIMAAATRAADQVNAYRSWKRAWDNMADRAPSRWAGWWKKPLGALLAGGMLCYMLSQAGRSEYQMALGWMALFGVVAAIVWLVQRLRRGAARRRIGKVEPVRVVATRRWASPDLARAYRALPDYCLQAMQR